MTPTRQGRFKIAIQTAKTAHFAVVELTVEPAEADEIILDADARGWSESVRHGVAEGLAKLRRRGSVEPVRVTVTKFLAMVIDTRKADAEAAALLATLSAFLKPSMMPMSHFSDDEKRWLLDWPAADRNGSGRGP